MKARALPEVFRLQAPLILGAVMLLLAAVKEAAATDTNEFLPRIYTNAARQTLPYRLLKPKRLEAGKAYPIILYLHGAAARGDDNLKPLEWGPLLFLEPPLRDKHDFFLVAP